MKKIFFVVAALFCASTIFAQVEKGRWLVGGRTNLSFTSQDQGGGKFKQTNFSLSPRIGYLVQDKWAITANPGYESQTTQFGSNPKQKYNEFDFGLGTQYYLLEKDARLNVYVEGMYLVGSYKDYLDERISYNKYHLGANAICFINKYVGFEFGAGYSSRKYENEDERISQISFGTGFQIYLDPCAHKKNGKPEIVSKS